MKLTYIYLLAVLSSLAISAIFPQPCYANPIDPDFPITGRYDLWVFALWIICPPVEASIIGFLLRRNFKSIKAFIRPFLLIVLLNLITLPITQFIGTLIIANNNIFQIAIKQVYLAELFPLIVECFVLFWIFQSMYRRGSIFKPITFNQTFFLTIVVNVVTFAIGFSFYRYFPSIFTNP